MQSLSCTGGHPCQPLAPLKTLISLLALLKSVLGATAAPAPNVDDDTRAALGHIKECAGCYTTIAPSFGIGGEYEACYLGWDFGDSNNEITIAGVDFMVVDHFTVTICKGKGAHEISLWGYYFWAIDLNFDGHEDESIAYAIPDDSTVNILSTTQMCFSLVWNVGWPFGMFKVLGVVGGFGMRVVH